MKTRVKEAARRLVEPVAGALLSLRITPDQVTLAGLLLSFLAAAGLAAGRFRSAAALLFLGAVCDMLDGSMARRSHRSTRFGAFLDSTIDRYAELAVFLGLAVHFARQADVLHVGIAFAAAAGSILVSYARARAEGLGLDCRVGLMERPERLVLLIAAAAIGPGAMKVVLWVLAALTHFTALQRILHVRALLGREAE